MMPPYAGKTGGESSVRQSNDDMLGAMPVPRLVVTMSLPIMLSMLISAVYNLVDSVYVAQYSDEAFLALSYAYPVQMLLVAFCSGIGVGFSATFSRRLGEGDREQAASAVCHGFFLYGLCWLLFLLFALTGAAPFLRLSTEDPSVARQGAQYLLICCGLSIGTCMQFLTERILQAMGRPAGFMIVQGSGAILNLILDPIFIFVLDLGVAGAAAATVIGQISGALIGFWLVYRLRHQLPIRLRGFRPRGEMLAEMGRVAAPAVVMQSLSSFMSLGLNQLLTRWSQSAVFVLGAYFKLQTFIFMPIFGISSGLIPILSYNYGSGALRRVSASVRFGQQFTAVLSLSGALLLSLLASPLLRSAFRASPEALAMGAPALRIIALSFFFAGTSIIFCSAFQSLGRSRWSLLVALLRQILLLLPAAALLLALKPALVWAAFPLSELISCTAAALLYRRTVQKQLL